MLFEQYRMSLNRDKYDIEVQNDDALKRKLMFFDFRQRMLNIMDGLYINEMFHLIDTIIKYQPKKESAAEIKNWTEKKRP